MEGKKVFRVGSRKSALALIQTNHVIDCMRAQCPDVEFEIVTMTTLGDRILDVSLPKIGEKSLFTKDLEDALHSGSVDFVVHSLKDLPTSLPEGLAIGAVLEREDPRDALVLRKDLKEHTLESLPPQSCIGTSSLRRTAQLRALYPQLRVEDVRGNLNTRLNKLDGSIEGSREPADVSAGAAARPSYSALVLARSGLQRMGWQDRVSQVLPCAVMMYAVGQGALAVECRAGNTELLRTLATLNHAETYCRVLAERSFLKTLGGGCSAPVGVSTTLKPFEDEHRLTISGAVWSLDGQTKVSDQIEHKFTNIHKRTNKHSLSPEKNVKRMKTDDAVNPVEEYNRLIDERKNVGCEDVRSAEEIEALATSDGDTDGGGEGSANGGKSKLYCGLTVNVNLSVDVIEKCEELGRDLAILLISKGALEVMKTSQDFIRSSIKK